jgi:hypothetical protein
MESMRTETAREVTKWRCALNTTAPAMARRVRRRTDAGRPAVLAVVRSPLEAAAARDGFELAASRAPLISATGRAELEIQPHRRRTRS